MKTVHLTKFIGAFTLDSVKDFILNIPKESIVAFGLAILISMVVGLLVKFISTAQKRNRNHNVLTPKMLDQIKKHTWITFGVSMVVSLVIFGGVLKEAGAKVIHYAGQGEDKVVEKIKSADKTGNYEDLQQDKENSKNQGSLFDD